MQRTQRTAIASKALFFGAALLLATTACDPNGDRARVCALFPDSPSCRPPTPPAPDAGTADSGTPDAGAHDAGAPDAGAPDAGAHDAGAPDAGAHDAGTPDAGTPDAGTADAGAPDSGPPDAGTADAGTSDAGTAGGAIAPSTYTAYSGTDYKAVPPAPALGPANSAFNDPVFGSRILRVTDTNTLAGSSVISTDAGFHRTFNANSTAIKLTDPHGSAYWMEFNGAAFKVGDGSATPKVHTVPFPSTWEWSAVNPDIIYYLNGSQIAAYDKSAGKSTNLGGPSNGDPTTYSAVVIGADKWICSAAGAGQQDTYTKAYCVQPANPSVSKFIDVVNRTINGVVQTDPNWPVAAAGQTLGIHSISGSTGASWVEITFHQQNFGANGTTVFNLDTGKFSLLTNGDYYWSGHVFLGNGKFVNGSGSKAGNDSRGMLMRSADKLMDASQYLFFMAPPTPTNNWCDADHSSWFNSFSNPGAPVLQSRYTVVDKSLCQFAWTGEIVAGATDGSNKVWRFAHNHNGGSVCYYEEAFAQISNDGKWALFSSPWDDTLGAGAGTSGNFGCSSRIDTFLVELK